MGICTKEDFKIDFTLIIMDSASKFVRIPYHIDLHLDFIDNQLDFASINNLKSAIDRISGVLGRASKLFSPHYYDDKGKATYLRTDVSNNPINQGTYSLTNTTELEAFVDALKVILNNQKQPAPTLYTPLLAQHKTTQSLSPEQGIEETGTVAHVRKLFTCCFN